MQERYRIISALAFFAIITASPHAGADKSSSVRPPDAAQGKSVSLRFCAGCHLVPGSNRGTVQDGIPTFQALANQTTQTAQSIRNILIRPHPPMPDLKLTTIEIENVIAFLDELRSEDAGPALLEKPKQKKKKPPKVKSSSLPSANFAS